MATENCLETMKKAEAIADAGALREHAQSRENRTTEL